MCPSVELRCNVVVAITVVNDGAKLYICEDGAEKQLHLDRGDVLLFRGDVVHSGAEAPEGHFGRIHVYVDSERVLHDRQTFFGDCSSRLATRKSRRLKLTRAT